MIVMHYVGPHGAPWDEVQGAERRRRTSEDAVVQAGCWQWGDEKWSGYVASRAGRMLSQWLGYEGKMRFKKDSKAWGPSR